METTNSSLKGTGEGSPIQIVNEAQYFLSLQVSAVVYISTTIFGIVANVLNIRTFTVLGLRDGVTISFFALSVSDLFYLCVFLALRIFTFLSNIEYENVYWFPVDPYVLIFFTGNALFITSFCSMAIVTFISVVRCLCVAMPLHFKSMFTKTRCTACLAFFAMLAVSIYTPILANMGVKREFDSTRNASRLFMWFSKDRERIKDIIWLLFDTILPVIVQFVLVGCAVAMTYALRKSATFRQSRTPKPDDVTNANTSSNETKLGSRDLRVVYQVMLISVIYVIANVPKVFNSLYTQFQAKFDVNKPFHYFYLLLNDLRMLFECINATVNFFVYYKFNRAFRKACFNCKRKS